MALEMSVWSVLNLNQLFKEVMIGKFGNDYMEEECFKILCSEDILQMLLNYEKAQGNIKTSNIEYRGHMLSNDNVFCKICNTILLSNKNFPRDTSI